ncbi:translocation/assembly module TamB domain-containing protein [Ancylobacter sp. MQZ15Z-1]|uniref:Translocation/assembly module TamB domain-containing protein n=1 Tax=Ancylobacter mangrovi TaxID=2972472 RepID=A0A9X2T0F7_9HYPH|nr:translocation/assembly module TamB domain-containing protein [Ancylobacter mangrovi]MCS0493507.1 translocation/assembly module TamB domain-containing protein [Ancylobacter mangrovi]
MKRFLKVLGITLLALVGVVLLAFGAIQTPPGKAMLARLGSSLASSEGLKVGISDIRGFVPFDMSVGRIEAADAKGTFAEIDNLRLAWRPLELLRRTLDVTRLEADALKLARLPELPPAAPSESSGGTSFALPVRVARLAIGDIDIAEPVLGHAARLSFEASADVASLARGLSLDFDLKRLDEPGSVKGRAAYAPETSRLELDIAASEPAGGLIARAAGLDGLPEIAATLKGAGPLDNWDGRLTLKAGDVAEAGGVAGIRAVGDAHRITFALDADIARLLPGDIAPLFEGRTELSGAATVDPNQAVALEKVSARAAGFGAALNGTISPERVFDLAFDVTVGDAARFSALAPGVSWQSMRLNGTLEGTQAAPALNASLAAAGLSGMGYGASTLDATFATTPGTGGTLALAAKGTAGGLSAEDPQVAGALGTSGDFSLAATVPSGPDFANAVLTDVALRLSALTARFDGRADAQTIAGKLNVERLDLAAFGPLAGRPLAGVATLDADVDGTTDLSRLSLTVKGNADKLATGLAQLDGLIGGGLSIDGALARDGENAISVNELKVNAQGLALVLDGRVATDLADLKAKLTLDNLARLDPRVSGALDADAAFSGTLENLGVTAKISIPDGRAMDHPIKDLALDVTATDLTGKVGGRFQLSGDVAGKPATGAGSLETLADDTRRLTGLDIAIGSVTARGDVALAPSNLVTGTLAVKAGNLADISALTLTEASGRLDADVTLDAADGRQRVAVKADAADVRFAGQRVGTAKIDATVVDPARVPLINGTVDLAAVDVSGVVIESAKLNAKGSTAGTDLTLDAQAQGVRLNTAGRLDPLDNNGARLRLDTLNATRGKVTIRTTQPVTFTVADGSVSIDKLALTAGSGSATVSGKAGQTLDLSVDIRALPLSLADMAVPGLGLTGTLAATARVTGTASAPTGNYQVTVSRLSSPDIANAGAGPFDIAANGNLANGRASITSTISGRNLRGVTVNGSVPIAGGNLDLAIRGAIDLAIINPLLGTTGARLTGNANIDATLRGTAAAPRAGGTVRISGGRFDDAVNGVSLDRIEAVITGTERSVTLTSFSARTSNGGTVTGRGNVALDPAAGLPGKIDLTLSNAALVNSDLMRLVAEGPLSVEGAFLRDPRITGRITLRALDISIPDRFPGGVQDLDVRHVNASQKYRQAHPARPSEATASGPSSGGMPLDLVIAAPNNTVFVRGMGVDAQLGGELRLTGTSHAPVTNGAFEMRRGTFELGSRRLTFTRGRITFTGNTDPELDFVAETTAQDITARVLISGPASQPDITFTSTPTLPQDEVLSRLLFGRNAGALNASQAIQLAQIVAQFSGGGTVLDSVRRSLGVDNLDVGADSTGRGGQVGLGRRLNDNIYLGVRQGTSSNSSRVTVDIDVTRNIKLQGATSASGAAEVGIGAQWDY